MDYIQAIAILACGVAIGAVCMHAHNWSVNAAANRERQRGEKREDRMRIERDTYMQQYQNAVSTIQKMNVEQANSSGYEDGYRAAFKDLESDEIGARTNTMIFDALRNGNSVSMRILNH